MPLIRMFIKYLLVTAAVASFAHVASPVSTYSVTNPDPFYLE